MIKLLALIFYGLKSGKLLLTGGTMLLSMVTYSFVFGWPYAVGFVLMILFHELGHYVAARQRGLNVGAPTFIPFVGAWIEMKDLPHDVETEAYVGLAGPVAGTVAALACYFLARSEHSPLLLALAYAGLMLNLFNLIPLSPLDGGRITAIISPKMWWLGVPILGGLFLVHPSPMLILIAVFAIPQLLASRRGDGGRPPGYYQVALGKRIEYACWYLGLTVLLALMSYSLHQRMAG